MTGASAARRSPRDAARIGGEVAFILLLPPVLFFAYGAVPINQANFLDPFVYTGYVNNFTDLIERYGLTYYSVRFGLIFPALVLVRLLGPAAGHFALVFCFYLVAGVPLYLAIRKHFGVAGARVGYVTFVSSVWVAATLLSHYPASAAVAYLVGGTALIMLDPGRRVPAYVIVGVLFALAAHSNVFATAYAALAVIPYCVINFGRIRARLAADVLSAVAGLAAATLGGMLVYWLVVGHWNIFRPTLQTIGAAGQIVADYPPRQATWFASAVWLLYPPMVLAAAALLWVWRSARSRMLLASALYAAACGLFLFGWSRLGAGLSNHFAFALLAGSVILLACVISATIVNAGRLTARQGALAAVLFALAPAAWVTFDDVAVAVNSAALVVVVACVVAVVALAPLGRGVALAAGAVFALGSHLTFVAGPGRGAYQPDPAYWQVFGAGQPQEWETYRLAIELMSAMPRLADDEQPLRFWYPPGSLAPGSFIRFDTIQATYLWGYSRLPGLEMDHGAPEIRDAERAVLLGAPFRLAVLGANAQQLQDARTALEKERVRFASVFERRLCAGSRCLFVELLDISSARGYWLSGGVNAPRRPMFAADAATLEQTLERNLYGAGKEGALVLASGRLVYTPTSPEDHLATKFVDIGGHALGVRLTIQLPADPIGRCRVVLQSQSHHVLGTAPCGNTAPGVNAPNVLEFAVPAGTTSVRVLLVSPDHRRVDLPSDLRVELLESSGGGS